VQYISYGACVAINQRRRISSGTNIIISYRSILTVFVLLCIYRTGVNSYWKQLCGTEKEPRRTPGRKQQGRLEEARMATAAQAVASRRGLLLRGKQWALTATAVLVLLSVFTSFYISTLSASNMSNNATSSWGHRQSWMQLCDRQEGQAPRHPSCPPRNRTGGRHTAVEAENKYSSSSSSSSLSSSRGRKRPSEPTHVACEGYDGLLHIAMGDIVSLSADRHSKPPSLSIRHVASHHHAVRTRLPFDVPPSLS
jgi:hypothetical protein